MAFLPILIDVKGAPCLVAGGGHIALHNVQKLLEHGADVTVIAPEICSGLAALPVKVLKRTVTAEDTEGMLLVFDSTGDEPAQEMLSGRCKREHIPYICSGRGELCTAMLPAVLKRGRTVVAVSSLGASPAASVWLRDKLAGDIPEDLDAILDKMAELRTLSRELFSEQPKRSAFLHGCLDYMLKNGTIIDKNTERTIAENVTLFEEAIR